MKLHDEGFVMFKGSFVALVTPMDQSGAIDFAALTDLVQWHLAEGTDGLVILGTTGESATVTFAEREMIIQHVVKQVDQRVPVIVGTGTHATASTITLTQHAAKCGADGVLVVCPYYNKPTQEGLYQHFRQVAQSMALPVILYNVPSRAGCDLLPETVMRLADIPNIVALKEAVPGAKRVKELKLLNCSLGLLSGDDATAKDFLLSGGVGVISVAANICPALMKQLCEAVRNEDRDAADQIDQRMAPWYKLLFVESNPIPCKWVLHVMQRIQQSIRLPLTPLDERYHAKIQAQLVEEGLMC